MATNNQTTSTSCLWALFEDTKISIPPHVKNILKFNCWDTILALSKLKAEDLPEIEKFVRDGCYEKLIKASVTDCFPNGTEEISYEEYFGKYYRSQKEFSFTKLEKRIIFMISDFAVEQAKKYAEDYTVSGKQSKSVAAKTSSNKKDGGKRTNFKIESRTTSDLLAMLNESQAD